MRRLFSSTLIVAALVVAVAIGLGRIGDLADTSAPSGAGGNEGGALDSLRDVAVGSAVALMTCVTICLCGALLRSFFLRRQIDRLNEYAKLRQYFRLERAIINKEESQNSRSGSNYHRPKSPAEVERELVG